MLSPFRSSPPCEAPQTSSQYRIGMPQLGLHGLSEYWLLAECGDRHWQLLSLASGMPSSLWRDSQGRRVYPAFRSVHLTDMAIESLREDDYLKVTSTLGRVSRTQFYSEHVLSHRDKILGRVQLISAFIARNEDGRNTNATRSVILGFDHITNSDVGAELADRERSWLRQHTAEQVQGSLSQDAEFIPISPCPCVHFNGAGFLYFARFLELVDQAQWSASKGTNSSLAMSERSIRYFGNMDVGDSVTAIVQHPVVSKNGQHHVTQLQRNSDSRPIAHVSTIKRPLP